MKKIVLSIIAMGFMFSVSAQSKKQEQDIEAIKQMCGCFEVTFNFSETFSYSKDSLYKPSRNKVSKALEWAALVTNENDKISLQHILQVGNPAKPMIVKHWRQDWLFENRKFYMYNTENDWVFEKKRRNDVSGQWTQKVFQVDDSPRYEGSGTWVHVDGKSYWENTTTAPLPRREYTTRSDYNLTMRGNRQEIKDFGWVHDQDNDKIVREIGKEDLVIAKEKGYNTYIRVDDSRCAAAANWWEENTNKWATVRFKWDEIYNRDKDLSLEAKVDNKALYKHLFDDALTQEVKINLLIESFVKKQ
tara:strand:+ start:552 stop:1460 length:909 start_codon:yes stop_codon:yes gene_type:complete